MLAQKNIFYAYQIVLIFSIPGRSKYVEDLKRDANAEVGQKDYFEIASSLYMLRTTSPWLHSTITKDSYGTSSTCYNVSFYIIILTS